MGFGSMSLQKGRERERYETLKKVLKKPSGVLYPKKVRAVYLLGSPVREGTFSSFDIDMAIGAPQEDEALGERYSPCPGL